MRHLSIAALVLAACSGDDGTDALDTDTGVPVVTPTADTFVQDTAPPDGACGDVTYWQVTVRGIVQNEQRVGAPFATVSLEERGWHLDDTVMGSAFTDGSGNYEFEIPSLVSVEDCWGTILDYVIVAELGPQRGEDQINTYLFNAIDGKKPSLVADMSLVPLVMADQSKK